MVDGKPCFDVVYNSTIIQDIQLSVYGEHNILNALATACVAKYYGIDDDSIRQGLNSFSGASRRFEVKKYHNGAPIIDDYAHHPTEIESTLKVASECEHNRTICIFQPHTYTRTNAFLKDFAKALSMADEIILTDIFAAREKNTLGISSLDLKREIDKAIKLKNEYYGIKG